MKLIVENAKDMVRVVGWYCDGTISADEYYASVDEYAKRMVDYGVGHKTWIKTEKAEVGPLRKYLFWLK